MTDTSADRPFNAFLSPSPFRIPNVILWGGGVLIGFAMLAINYFSGVGGTSGSMSMMILIGGSVVVSGCAFLAHQQRGGPLALYFGTAMLLVVATWIAFDDFQSRRNMSAAERQLGVGLTQLCQSAGGEDLGDPVCAGQRRVLDNYYDAKWGEAPGAAATP